MHMLPERLYMICAGYMGTAEIEVSDLYLAKKDELPGAIWKMSSVYSGRCDRYNQRDKKQSEPRGTK